MGKKKKSTAPRYSSDELMLNVMECLCNDAKLDLGHMGGSSVFEDFASKDIGKIRDAGFLLHDNLDVKSYKWFLQLNSYLKRYTFQNDLYTCEEREVVTNVKFTKLQEALAANYWMPRTFRLHQVLCRTREIVRRVLDGFEPQGEIASGRFGTKATVGCSAADAFIDLKLTLRPITGSVRHQLWLKNTILPQDPLLEEIINSGLVGPQIVDCLAQVNVPKKFNIDRGINPNTLLGSLYSDIIGRNIEQALREEGLDIRKLQSVHAVLAQKASIHGKWVTADLSDASHGFLSNLLNALLPRKWYRAVMYGVIRKVDVAGQSLRLESIMTMGIGFTFPMQTLLFYCLLKAISQLTGCWGKISVYGDDLIYPTKMHPYVVSIFTDLGFKLNLDKTFVHSKFRESCGSDFFSGQAVRPFAPEGESSYLGRTSYAAFCYKLLNGFLRRWSIAEISSVVHLLCKEITRVMGGIFIVPVSHPDHSGLKLATSEYSHDFLWYNSYPTFRWIWNQDTYAYDFPFLQTAIGRRYVTFNIPYYWDTLRTISQRDELPISITDYPDYFGVPLFKWRPGVKKTYFTDSKGRRRVRKYATVSDKSHLTRYSVITAREHTRSEGIHPT